MVQQDSRQDLHRAWAVARLLNEEGRGAPRKQKQDALKPCWNTVRGVITLARARGQSVWAEEGGMWKGKVGGWVGGETEAKGGSGMVWTPGCFVRIQAGCKERTRLARDKHARRHARQMRTARKQRQEGTSMSMEAGGKRRRIIQAYGLVCSGVAAGTRFVTDDSACADSQRLWV